VTHLAIAFGWCTLAGFLMSMGGGGGGILIGVGHISIVGVADPNMIKAVNQMMEFVSRIFSVPLYQRQGRIVWSLALSFGLGAPLGAIGGSWISERYLADMSLYRQVFGLLVAFVAARILYEGWAKAALKNIGLRRARDASERVHSRVRASGSTRPSASDHARTISSTLQLVRVRFGGEQFDFKPLAAAAGGFAISFIAALVGVGGGFLVTPFMASVLLFPMYLVVGTSLVALMIPLAVSVATYIALRVQIDWALVGTEIPGIVAGSLLGPVLNSYFNEKALKTFVAVVLLGIGIYYLAV
jgi:uncharacterized membrane protein YfcA